MYKDETEYAKWLFTYLDLQVPGLGGSGKAKGNRKGKGKGKGKGKNSF